MYAFLPRALPAGLDVLTELALDLRWTWSHAGDALWHRLDPELWEQTHNPWFILQTLPQTRLEALVADPSFMESLRSAVENRRCYLADPGWYAQAHTKADIRCVAYFSMEFGLSESFPLYAGGLGILAGDFLKTASDLGVPVVGVGLLYHEGYFRQIIDASSRQREAYPHNDATSLPIQPAISSNGAWLKVALRLPGRRLFLRVWQANVGRVRLYLLDSNDLANSASDRGITSKLYIESREMRMLQEIALGIGGCALLELLGIDVDVCHLNEGHAALVVLERVRRYMHHNGVGFHEAWWATRAGNVFTTHTPVAAGFDTFSPELVRKYSSDYQHEFGMPERDLLALGRINPDDDDEPFNMTYLALRGCARSNGVSELHGEVSRRLFRGLYPRWPEPEVPVGHVTNGIHVPSWDSPWADQLWTDTCGKGRWLGNVAHLQETLAAIDDETLWSLAANQRQALVRHARDRMTRQLSQRGEGAARVADARQMLDPNILTLGLARRFATYKRPNLLLTDPQRFERLLLDPRRPLQIIVAGKAHPEDEEGKRLITEWLEFARRPELRARVVFLEDYDMLLAQQLVQGVDLWINTPRRPWEACGTSGMKVLANGGLNLSELDGWWAEAYSPDVGWAIGDRHEHENGRQDRIEADQLYRVLEEQVLPAFYDRDARGIPLGWIARMRASMSQLAPAYSSNRMMLEYVSRYYVPAAAAFRRRCADKSQLSRELHQWQAQLAIGWREILFGQIEVQREAESWKFRVPVYLGDIPPGSVKVELYAAAQPDAGGALRIPMTKGDALPGAANGFIFTAAATANRPAQHYTARVVPFHPEACVPAEVNLIAWQR